MTWRGSFICVAAKLAFDQLLLFTAASAMILVSSVIAMADALSVARKPLAGPGPDIIHLELRLPQFFVSDHPPGKFGSPEIGYTCRR